MSQSAPAAPARAAPARARNGGRGGARTGDLGGRSNNASPPLALPTVGIDGDEPDGADNLALAIWAAKRTGMAVTIAGRGNRADFVLTRLREAGISA